jgi:hypothetical protein
VTGGNYTVTVTGDNFDYAVVAVMEINDLPSDAVDTTASATGNNTSPVSGTTSVPSQAHTLSIAVLGTDSVDSGDTNIGIDLPAGFTNAGIEQNAWDYAGFSLDYRLNTSAAAQSASWGALDSGAVPWGAGIAVFKANGAPAGTPAYGQVAISEVVVSAWPDTGGPVVYTVTSTGGITLGGAASLSRTIIAAASGGITFGGAASISFTRVAPDASGGITFAGAFAANVSRTYEHVASGGITFAGALFVTRTFAVAPTGGITFSGSSVVTRVDVSEHVMTGGITFSGTWDTVRAYAHVMTGGITVAGAPSVARTFAVVPTGGITVAGAPSVARTFAVVPTGGITVAGTGAAILVPAGANVYEHTASGGIVFTGAATVDYVPVAVVPAPGASGQYYTPRFRRGAFAHVPRRPRTVQYAASGGIVFGGSAVVELRRRQDSIPLAVLAVL